MTAAEWDRQVRQLVSEGVHTPEEAERIVSANFGPRPPAEPNGNGQPAELPPLPPGFTGHEAEICFLDWKKAPNPLRLADSLKPLLPWLQARHDQYRDQMKTIEAADPAFGNMRAVSVAATSIVMKRARWLWDSAVPQIPLGELAIGAGREGAAKSQFTIWLAAAVTRGDLPGDLAGQPRAVIICAREDDWEHTIKPRLVAAGADLAMVFQVKAQNVHSGKSYDLTLPTDNELLEAEIIRLGAALVIFDPLLSVLDGKLNTHRAGDVRAALEPLADLAHRTGCAMFGLAHFAKMEGRDAASLISGSHAFKDVARAILVFARDSEETGLLSQPKNNLGRVPSHSLAYSVQTVTVEVSDGQAVVPRFVPSELTLRNVEDLLDTGRAREVAKARDFLRGALGGGERLSKDISDEAKQHGISERTLIRARQDLGVVPRKDGSDGQWYITLPGSVGTVGVVGVIGSLHRSEANQPPMPRQPTAPLLPRAREADYRDYWTHLAMTMKP